MRPKVSVSVLLFLFFLSLYAFTLRGHIRFGDEAEKYLTAQSVVARHDLAIQFDQDLHRHIGLDGRNYSFYELGSTLPLVPFYAFGELATQFFRFEDPDWITILCVGLLNPVLTALTCIVLHRFALAIGNPKSALFTTMLFGLATIAWPYSRGLEREPILALCILLSVYAVFRFRLSGETKWLLGAGISLGYLFFAKIATIILFPFLAIYLVAAFVPLKKALSFQSLLRLSCFAIPIVVLVGIQAAYNFIRYGNWMDIGLIGELGDPVAYMFSLAHLGRILPALLYSPEKSMFFYSPPLVLFLPGWLVFLRDKRREALLVGSLFLAILLFYSLNYAGDGGGWWGPKYMVAITSLGLLPVSSLLANTENLWRRFWCVSASIFGLIGLGVQTIAVHIDESEYNDVTASIVDLAKGWDFWRHGVIDSLTVHLSPAGQFIQVNPFGVTMLFIAALLLVCILNSMRQGGDDSKASHGWSIALLVLVLLIQLVSFITWIVAPYPQVLQARANTRFVAGKLFLADSRNCEASAMYLQALAGRTIYLTDAFMRIGEALPRAQGRRIAPSDLVANVQASEGAMIEEDDADSLNGESALKISLPAEKNGAVSVYTDPIGVQPNKKYEFSGWIKVERINGEKYAVVSIVEDDGNWGNGRGTDILSMSGTHGWQPFAQTITTLPTTRRVFLMAGLWRTHGTVWLGLLQFAKITEDNPATKTLKPCAP